MAQVCQDFNKESCYRGGQNPEKSTIWSWIGIHPAFSQAYSRCHNHLLSGDGPLPADLRHFVAIMACNESKCVSLLEEEKGHFLRAGGDSRKIWLESMAFAPLKLKRLATLNTILGARPWAFNQQHIKAMLTGDGSWSLAELLQAIVILVHFHSACSYAIGADSPSSSAHAQTLASVSAAARSAKSTSQSASSRQNNVQKSSCDSNTEFKNGVQSLINDRGCDSVAGKVKTTTASSTRSSLKFSLRSATRAAHNKKVVIKEAMAKEMVNNNNNNTSTATTTTTNTTTTNKVVLHTVEEKDGLVSRLDSVYGQYLPSVDQEEQALDPAQFSEQEHHLNINDFNWDDHGFSVMSRFYGDMSLLLDDKFRVAKQMTYNSYGDQSDVDTSSFRRAVWNYVQMMFGVIHEDFDYSSISQLLSPGINQFVMVAAKFPHRIKPSQTSNLLLDFNRSEKAHLSILIVEAKLQALLLYSLRAVMNHMAKR